MKKTTPPKKKTPASSAPILQANSEDQGDLPTARMTPGCHVNAKEHHPGTKLFTIGHARDDGVDSVSKVQEMKMNIEKRIRQGKRWSVVEDTRKRIITPAKAKRIRGDDGEWSTPSQSTVMEQQPAMIAGKSTKSVSKAKMENPVKKIQTPINSFLVLQTLEDRALQLRKPTSSTFTGAGLSNSKEMSALSPASPVLRRSLSRKTGTKDVRKGTKDEQKTPRKVNTIVTFLQKRGEDDKKHFNSGQASNNNQLYARTEPVISTRYGHEMAANVEESHGPIATQADDHVINKTAQGPISSQIENEHDDPAKSSHFGGGIGPEQYGE